MQLVYYTIAWLFYLALFDIEIMRPPVNVVEPRKSEHRATSCETGSFSPNHARSARVDRDVSKRGSLSYGIQFRTPFGVSEVAMSTKATSYAIAPQKKAKIVNLRLHDTARREDERPAPFRPGPYSFQGVGNHGWIIIAARGRGAENDVGERLPNRDDVRVRRRAKIAHPVPRRHICEDSGVVIFRLGDADHVRFGFRRQDLAA
mmetsp:Transcript_1207/g.2445  ORF Transcript_1207/g.2445 Transcript_1207/m.2445 type:complete len:204 (-) Transcript_1207:261-872(-)